MMKAGTYYVGDLCYVMHPEWDEMCNLFFAGRNDHGCNEGEFTLKDGRQFANFNTKYGDGTYSSTSPNQFSVDSGSIGCILLDDIRDESYSIERIKELGAIITFDKDFEVKNDNGTLVFGEIEIYTDYDPYEEEEEYYDEEEEYEF